MRIEVELTGFDYGPSGVRLKPIESCGELLPHRPPQHRPILEDRDFGKISD